MKNEELLLNGYRLSVLQDEKSSGDSSHNMNVFNIPGVYLKMVTTVNFKLCVFYHN